jgi:hypothetical protein
MLLTPGVAMLLLATLCHGFQLRHDVHTQPLPAPSRCHSAAALRTTAVQCREPYVPSWAQGGSAKKNVYAEQRTEYEEYAKALASKESMGTPPLPPSLEAIEDALRAALAPVHHLNVSDVTDGHAVEGVRDGRALRADGREILVLVVSDR